MTEIRLRYRKEGGHYHCRLFTARGKNLTYAKCGDLVFDEQEWPEVLTSLECGGIEVLQDGESR